MNEFEPGVEYLGEPDPSFEVSGDTETRSTFDIMTDSPLVVETPTRGHAIGSGVREILVTIVPALLIALLIHLFVAQATRVESYSMEPTLFEENRLIIDKISYRLRLPERGEIVVLDAPDGGDIPLIKRVIGLPGETISIRNSQVFINDKPLVESYLQTVTHGELPPTIIPETHIFVLGDNRDHSRDSRSFGPVALDELIGRAWFRYWPVKKIGFFQSVQ